MARAVDVALRKLDFEVELVQNATRRKLGTKLVEFVNGLGRGDTALFYFAGHGVHVDGENYLVSTDHAAVSDAEIRLNELGVTRVAEELSGTEAVAVLVLDACRNDPFQGRSTTSVSPQDALRDTLIAFAASRGETSNDGEPGKGGVFTREFVRALGVPGLEAVDLFQEVRERVREASGGKQRPAYREDLLTPLVLHRDAARARPFRDCLDCPEMVPVPAGRLETGSAAGEAGRTDEEGSSGTAIAPFALSRYEVTFEEYEHFVEQAGGRRRVPSDAGWGRMIIR